MPTVTGQFTAAAVRPRARMAAGSVVTRMSRAYQNHAMFDVPSGSRMRLSKMPCLAGRTPVMSVVCDGYVTDGSTPVTPRAQAPCCISRRIVGIFAGPGCV